MRALLSRPLTPEQLAILSRNQPGVEIIRGAAGSGKTTTALLRIGSLAGSFVSRRERLGIKEPVRILVLTYNRTLRGYISNLADNQVKTSDQLILDVATFSYWARSLIGNVSIIDSELRERELLNLSININLEDGFLLSEVEYAMGRFMPSNIDAYVQSRRDGRGAFPRMGRSVRTRLVEEVIRPYQSWLDAQNLWDWNDLAVYLANNQMDDLYDVIIVDEAQDFSANQIRAVRNQLRDDHCLTLIVDTAQRIYARGFSWQEVGIRVRPNNSHRLKNNYRNTVEIAQFAAPLLDGLPIDDDGTMPDFSKSTRHGDVPVLVVGRYSRQVEYALSYIEESVDLESESVAFLHLMGGGWFRYLREQLERLGLEYVEISRRSDWPEGEENIALSTLHSVKGLEFDHVIILGVNKEVTPHGEDEEDSQLITLRRLLAMGIGRARISVMVGYKLEDASSLIDYLNSGTYTYVEV